MEYKTAQIKPVICLFAGVVSELLRRGYTIRFKAHGHSMQPTIFDGEVITIVPLTTTRLKKRDIVLYRAGSGLVAHRIHQAYDENGSGGFVITCGDASTDCDPPVRWRQIMGKVTAVERNGFVIELAGPRARLSHIFRRVTDQVRKRIARLLHVFSVTRLPESLENSP